MSLRRVRWLARLLIAPVLFWNLQAAITFLLWPDRYAGGFEISGVPGRASVQALGLLFLMWNVPYLVALVAPVAHRMSLIEAVCMQGIGLVGESAMRLALPAGHAALSATAERFIVFDGAGFVLLLAALMLSIRHGRETTAF